MENSAENKSSYGLTIRDCFDRVFYQHMDSLIGSHYGIEGLPLNLVNVTCLILLAEQITDEMESFSNSQERHTRTSLFRELSEMGLTLEDDTEVILEDIIQKRYVEIDVTGSLSAMKPALSMAQLLDRTFPKMPGLNLIASLVQYIDEIRSGRKDLETGLRFFDQTLKTQGVSLAQQMTPAPPRKTESPPLQKGIESGRIIPRPTPKLQKQKLSDNYQIRTLRGPHTLSPLHTSEKEIKTTPSDGVEIREIALSDPVVPEGRPRENPELGEVPLSEKTPELSPERTMDWPGHALEGPVEASGVIEDKETFYPAKAADDFEDSADASPADDALAPSRELPSPGPPMPAETGVDRETAVQGTESGREVDPSESESPIEDDDIEERIRTFEQTLSLQCPLCKTGVISSETTSTGKVFYKCAEPDCNFISWGKPHHLQCPQCKNPFLVVINKQNSAPILKCPRATCSYWQDYSSKDFDTPMGKVPDSSQTEVKVRTVVRRPKKRVVRRRVVRRKS